MKKLTVYYLVATAILFILNFAEGTYTQPIFFFLPLVIVFDYLIIMGVPGGGRSKKISAFLEDVHSVLTLTDTFNESTKGKIIDSENLKKLKEVVLSLEEKLRKPSELQRKLYIFSAYAAPLFPLAVMLSSVLVQRRTEVAAGIFSYCASGIIVALSRKAFSSLEKTIQKLNNEIRKAVDDITL
ncbi:hypothetical protein V511_02845 [Mesotoga sp. Brook.08.YT.4.2.5.1]|uniref:Uncharacterized protein n=1 Tax=Mesotoga prima TaxID=1184387 RepID=A0A101HT40_9BACT|nr:MULTISPECIES: hypothetical protein [unclassified Mesotoga]KUK82319.1 MAG: Uncharacterized protein XD94_0057 [Mesotoga prima]MDD3461181.1 hypothetical protein [Mesotoga sp.]PNE23296.1 hypothetical protein V511_02845 [Mesotoga sp. Brook.08.YT.4.2.5.1]PNS37945.1 hypothetical protein RJ60_10750 [Mesotoga sp. B105.6.4]PVD17408.1 hypothetical protein V512_010875 [Mesotoga sp. Brook.08.105.5.1]